MLWLIFLAGTLIPAAFAAYLAGYKAGEREQMRQTLRDIEVLRRAEDDRVQVDPRPYGMARMVRMGGETYDEMLASVLDDMRAAK